jgi:low affinity Fe/Cu permease
MKKASQGQHWFSRFAISVSELAGSPRAFQLATLVLICWAALGPFLHYSDTWQLWINTGTTIVTFLMVFIVQYTQNRDARALHLKLDELLRALKGAHTELAGLKDLSDEDLTRLEQAFGRLARYAQNARANNVADKVDAGLNAIEEIEKEATRD